MRIIAAAAVFALLVSAANAETIYLKNGKKINGAITSRTEKTVVVDIEGIAITYFMDEIDHVGELQEASPSQPAASVVSEEKPLAKQEAVMNTEVSSGEPSGAAAPQEKPSAQKNMIAGTVIGAQESSSELDPETAALLNAAYASVTKGDFTGGIENLQKAIEHSPDTAGLYSNLGIAYLYSGKVAEAASSFEKAIELDPKDFGAYSNLGHIYKETGQFEKAITVLTKALELSPDTAELHLNLGTVYNSSKQCGQAKEILQKALAMQPKTVPPEVYSALCNMHLGYALKTLGEFDEAKQHLLTARGLYEKLGDPNSLDYINNLLAKMEGD